MLPAGEEAAELVKKAVEEETLGGIRRGFFLDGGVVEVAGEGGDAGGPRGGWAAVAEGDGPVEGSRQRGLSDSTHRRGHRPCVLHRERFVAPSSTSASWG